MRETNIDREAALKLLKKYNKDPFHIRHAFTVEAVMGYLAEKEGYAEEKEYWKMAGLLHDIDFEMWPDQHCKKAPKLLKEGGASDEIIHSVVSHGYGICSDVEPEHIMEKILFAVDELTGLIWSASLMRPFKSCKDMELKSLKKKYKDKKFAAGVSRDIIKTGADMLGMDMDKLLDMTLDAMKNTEDFVTSEYEKETK